MSVDRANPPEGELGTIKSKSFVEPCSTPARRIDVGGLKMNVVTAGAGRPIVLIHGLGWDHTLWGRQIARLNAAYLVVAGDTRGHGETDKPAGPYSITKFVGDWTALLDRLELSSALILGFSLGGMIAQQLALSRPDLVGALILVNTACRAPAIGRAHMNERLAVMKLNGARAAAEVAARSVFSESWRNAHPDQLADFVSWREGQDQKALREVMRATADFDVTSEIPTIKVPTLLITSLGDQLMPPQAQASIAELIVGAEHIKVAEAGHMVSIEKPVQFDAILDDFLARRWQPLGPDRTIT
jgi:3-oxoadipate enol-lactonase